MTPKKNEDVNDTLVCDIDPFTSISEDLTLVSIGAVLSGPKFKLSDSLIDELKSYCISEEMLKNSFGTSQDVEAIAQTLKNAVMYRHRVTQVYTMLLDLSHDLEELGSNVQTYMYRKYSVYRGLKNEIQRKAAVDTAIPVFSKISTKVSKLLDIAKFVDEKLDKNEFTLRAILQSSERLWYSKEGIKSAK